MNILLVEDDEYKAADLIRVLHECCHNPQIDRAASVTSALRAIKKSQFDAVILDMSLPTFDLSGPGGGGSPQGQGGIEVLRLARKLSYKSEFIIVTQYPDIEINGADTPLSSAARSLSNLFSLNINRCLPYDFDSDTWRKEFRLCLAKLMSS